LLLSRIAAKRRHGPGHRAAPATQTPADIGVAVALDRVLDPLESLDQEEFESERRQAGPTEPAPTEPAPTGPAPTGPARTEPVRSEPVPSEAAQSSGVDAPLDGSLPWWLEGLVWCLAAIVACAAVAGIAGLAWLLHEHVPVLATYSFGA
jgi:hypothetical protein